MNPYLLFDTARIAGFNARKPAIDTQQFLMKAEEVVRAQPQTLILGSSRVAIGFQATSSTWPQSYRPVYNLAMSGASTYTVYRYLQHSMSQHPAKLVLLGLDLESSFAPEAHPPESTFARLAVNFDGGSNPQRLLERRRDLTNAVLSLDALLDSISTLAGNLTTKSSNTIGGNWEFAGLQYPEETLGFFPLWVYSNAFVMNAHYQSRSSDDAMTNVRAILDLCKAHGTQVILFINPYHADMLDTLAAIGHWKEIENWKRGIVDLAEKYSIRAGGSVSALWDFSDYDLRATETVPQDSPNLNMQWSLNFDHYNRAYGDAIIRQVLSPDQPVLGTLLTSGNIESHLAKIRDNQDGYHQAHPESMRRTQKLFGAIVALRSERNSRHP